MKTTTFLAVGLLLFCCAVQATELVYTPINPSFGGNPLNGSFLLGEANAQNGFHEPTPTLSTTNPVQTFQDTLTRSMLSMLANKIANAAFGNGTIDGDIPYEFGGYSINVHDQGNSLLLTITDPLGGQTTMTVGRITAGTSAATPTIQ